MEARKRLEEKLTIALNKEIKYTEKDGSSKLSVCDHSNWDKDLYNHRQWIIDKLLKRGYCVTVQRKFGVIDITTILIL